MSNEQETKFAEGRRDKHDIVMQILSMLKHTRSIRKTALMSRAGLSSFQMRYYLGFLEGNKLVKISQHEISITEKGLDHFEKCSCCPMFERSNAIWKFKNTSNMTLKLEDRQTASQKT